MTDLHAAAERLLTEIDGVQLTAAQSRIDFLKSKGLDYAEDFRTYQTERNQRMSRDGGNTMISTTGDTQYILSPNIPVGGFPGP